MKKQNNNNNNNRILKKPGETSLWKNTANRLKFAAEFDKSKMSVIYN